MSPKPAFNRRTYLLGLGGATAAAVGVPAAVSGGGGDDDDGTQEPDQPDGAPGLDEFPAAHPFVGDLDGDMAFDVAMQYDGDPADGDREWVVHCTTDGTETTDYPAMMVNVRERVEETVALADLDSKGFTLDFFVGPDHGQYIPGQVYLALQPPGMADENRGVGLYKNVRQGDERETETWHTLDIAQEMRDDGETDASGDDAPWRVIELATDGEAFSADVDTFADAILERAMETRDEGMEIQSVFGEYAEDTEVLGVGVGTGSSTTPTTRDIYFDTLQIPGHETSDDTTADDGGLDFPAALSMDASFESNGEVTATLAFTDDPENVSLDALLEDTVQLYAFSQITPPLDEGVEASDVTVSDGQIEATFPAAEISSLDRLGIGTQLVTVAGEFDYDHVVWFYGVGEVELPGN